MADFILIHGAWHAAWFWDRVIPLLQEKGHKVIAPDLPSHGADHTPKEEVTLARYVDRVVQLVKRQPEKVILVGHSLAGIVISQVGEEIPDRLERLIYVAAFLPADGETLNTYSQRDEESLIPFSFDIGDDGLARIKPEMAKDVFYARCRAEDIEWATAKLEPQNLAPTTAKLHLTPEKFGRVPKAYVVCTEDRAITVETQRTMLHNWTCDPILKIETDHSPMLSTPDLLAEELDRIAQTRA